VLILAAVIVFIGYVVFGVTGFGASPITIPMLAHFLSLTLVLALAAILDLASALVLSVHTRRQVDRRELYVLVPFTLGGLVLGVTLLVNLSRSVTLFALGAFVCAYALYAALRRDPPHGLSRRWAVPAGFSGGVLGALFGIGGPPYVMYLEGLDQPGRGLGLLEVGSMAGALDDFRPCSRQSPSELLSVHARHQAVALAPHEQGRGGDPVDALLEPLVRDRPDELPGRPHGPREARPCQGAGFRIVRHGEHGLRGGPVGLVEYVGRHLRRAQQHPVDHRRVVPRG
jgi:hypothetical protein